MAGEAEKNPGSLGRAVLLGIAAGAAWLSGLGLVAHVALDAVPALDVRILPDETRDLLEIRRLGELANEKASFTRSYLLWSRPQDLAALRAASASFDRQLRELEPRLSAPGGRQQLEEIRRAGSAADAAGKRVLDAFRAGTSPRPPPELLEKEAGPAWSALQDQVRALEDHELQLLRKEQERSRSAAERARRIILVTAVAAAGLSLALVGMAVRALRRLYAARVQAVRANERLYHDAVELSRLKDEFLATLSHELRTPLNAIVGWAHILRQEKLSGPLAQKAVETITRNAALQSRIVSDILDASRMMSGKLRLSVGPVDLAPVINAAVESIRPAAEAKGIRVRAILDYRAGPVAGDPDRLRQVVWNLLSNAIKFSPPEASVEVCLEGEDSEVAIVVADDGPGIPPEFLPHVFERFRQVDASSARSQGGLGLGLATVKHLVELQGGVVEAANRTEGTGAVFTVRLPRLAVAGEGAELPLERPRGGGGTVGVEVGPAASLTGVRVLVVDDQVNSRELTSAILLEAGAEVTAVSSMGDGLAALEPLRPHVLVADIDLPGEGGCSFLGKVRALAPERGGRTPAVALGAYAGSEERLRALRAGFQIHLSRPVLPEELARAVGSLAAVAQRDR